MSTSGPDNLLPLHDEHLQTALPALRALHEQMVQALRPCVLAQAPTALAAVLWQNTTTMSLLLDALTAETGHQQALFVTCAGDSLETAAGALRQARADLLPLRDLLSEEHDQQITDLTLATQITIRTLTLTMTTPAGTPGRAVIGIDPTTGRAAWTSPDLDLAPIGGRRHLELTSLIRRLADLLTHASPASATHHDPTL